MYHRGSPTSWRDLERMRNAEARAEAAEAREQAAISAFVRESRRDDTDPAMKFRVRLPSGSVAYAATRAEAESILRSAIREANPCRT